MKVSAVPSPEMERQQIQRILQEIGATGAGAEAVAVVQRQWAIVYGRPVAGGAFTYPYRRIVLRRGLSYRDSRGVLAHELYHAWQYSHSLVDSVQQEYEAEAFSVQICCELGTISEQERDAWFRAPREVHYARIRQYSAWHYRCLPGEQPTGIVAWWYAMKQFVGLMALQHRKRAPGL
jgi:hypothetical protein